MGGIFRAVGRVVKSVLGGGESKPKAPAAPPAVSAPTPMPVQDEASVLAAKKRAQAAAAQRRGRASTVLTQDSDTLGG